LDLGEFDVGHGHPPEGDDDAPVGEPFVVDRQPGLEAVLQAAAARLRGFESGRSARCGGPQGGKQKIALAGEVGADDGRTRAGGVGDPAEGQGRNPNHIQLFRSVPLAVDRSRFECWELQYPDGDEDYVAMVNEHWGRLKAVVAEDVEIWDEVAATRQSVGYRRNILNNRECKITAFHQTVQEMLDE
jgi:hypothetical protein